MRIIFVFISLFLITSCTSSSDFRDVPEGIDYEKDMEAFEYEVELEILEKYGCKID